MNHSCESLKSGESPKLINLVHKTCANAEKQVQYVSTRLRKMTARVQLLLAFAALLSVVSSSENTSVSSSDGFGHELAMVGLDAVNFK